MQKTTLTIIILMCIVLKTFGQDSSRVEKRGIYTGLSFGTWFPDAKNKVLGNPLLFGFMIDFKGEKNAFGLTFDLIKWPHDETTELVKIKFGDSVLTKNQFSGAHLTFDYAREFWSNDRVVFEGNCGLGYGRLSYYHPNKDIDIGKSSIVFNPGLSVRYLIVRKMYV